MSSNRPYSKAISMLMLLFLTATVAGCGSLKNSWGNFRAYYNTFYNADKNFRAGLEKVQNQSFEINPEDPVRIHRPPVQAGNSDFENVIDKGAQILREFPASKWVDDALLLIGKSYYYRQEFYLALEKFEELRNASESPEMEQLAIIWKGRTQLDIGLHSEGISFLETELNLYPESWSDEKKAEIQTLLAEHHAMLENWQESENALSNALPNIRNKKFRGRTLFLHGQILERLDRYGQAYFAFSNIAENLPGYEYEYWAAIKQADVARKEKKTDRALSIYEELRRDDKNFDRLDKINYEIARTLELHGDIEEAEKKYKKLLYDNQGTNIRSLKGNIYFRLGKIYSDNHDNFKIAAAYFDSSSTFGKETIQDNESPGAKMLADAFGEYTNLKSTISRADSLLWLGSLSPEKLDSALVTIRKQKREKFSTAQESKNRLVNKNLINNKDRAVESSIEGFLNHRNAELVANGKERFQIIWGNRPLADNWRRIEAVDLSNSDDEQAEQTRKQARSTIASRESQNEMNISDIPRTKESKKEIRLKIANAQYQLGSLFFLNLNLADSARMYFKKVVNSEDETELRARAMYSLYKLSNVANNSERHRYWRNRIIEEYAETKYAHRVDGEEETSAENDSSDKLRQQYQQFISSQQTNKPAKLRKLALANRSSEMASQIHFRAIKKYIKQARSYQKYSDLSLFDTKTISGKDTLLLPTNVVGEHRYSDTLEFKSMYWDSVRITLQEFDITFTNAKRQSQVAKLLEELHHPEQTNSAIPTCEKRGISVYVKPSMEAFLSTVVYPEKLKDRSLSGEIIYSFVVSPDGKFSSYRLESNKTSLGIEQAFENAFDKSLRFEPLKRKNLPPKIRCTVSFPIQR